MSEKKPTAKDRALAEREQLMRDYLAAFGLANPGKKAPTVRYESGYFHVSYGLFETSRYRKAELERMRDRLQVRAGGAEKK